jgi:ribosome-associated toxin RatA of RatAB toxin-antitoxin module
MVASVRSTPSCRRSCLALPRHFHGEAAQVVAAPLEECFALLAAVGRYPDWCPDIVRDVDVLDRSSDGQPSQVRMRMHIARGAFMREFDLFLAIVVEPPRVVTLTRVTDHPTNQEFTATWLLRPVGSTRLALRLDATLRVPLYVPAGGVGDAVAEGFIAAACRALAATPQ